MSGSGCFPTGLVGNLPLSTILPDSQSALPNRRPAGEENDSRHSPVAVQTLVPSPSFNGGDLSNFIATVDSYLDRSIGESTPTGNRFFSGSSGLAGIRSTLERREFQRRLANSSWTQEGRALPVITDMPGRSGLSGVVSGKSIHLIHL